MLWTIMTILVVIIVIVYLASIEAKLVAIANLTAMNARPGVIPEADVEEEWPVADSEEEDDEIVRNRVLKRMGANDMEQVLDLLQAHGASVKKDKGLLREPWVQFAFAAVGVLLLGTTCWFFGL